ncbi:MAG: MOSC domain-containing protein [Hyphomicrobiaceae bacterium]|nr:MOSC domain-containing protein [Hyphomicrobiaceae bacterium]
MSQEPGPRVARLYRYPVKGLSPEPLDGVALEAGGVVPFDRAYAIENGPGRFDPAEPRHLPKINFLMLMRDERLATLQTRLDTGTETLVILRQGRQVARGDLRTRIGRQMIEQFLSGYMAGSLRGPPRIVSAPGHSFSDMAARCVHIVNLASVREVERSVGRPVDPLRFRANIYLDGVEPWQELAWLDRELAIGDTRLAVFHRTRRCDATNVDPVSAARDLAIPATLLRTWGHSDFGVYAKVIGAGRISADDPVVVI